MQQELDRLRATLAARSRGAPLLFAPDAESEGAPIPANLKASIDLEAVVHKENLPSSIQETVASFSARQVARVAASLNPLALRIFGLLHLLSCEFAVRRAYHRNCAQLTFFCPAELVYAHLGITRGSFYRSLRELKALDLVDVRGHKTTVNGWQVRCDGSLWCVKLFPTEGKAARLSFGDLKAKYRDLEADIRAGATVWSEMRQSYQDGLMQVTFKCLLRWALTPRTQKNHVTLTVASDERSFLEKLLDIPLVPKQELCGAVDSAARALAAHLGDPHLNFYRYLIWQLLRLHNQGQDHLYAISQMVIRAGVDRREGFARCAGALFVSRLKDSGLWDALRNTPAYRVGAAQPSA